LAERVGETRRKKIRETPLVNVRKGSIRARGTIKHRVSAILSLEKRGRKRVPGVKFLGKDGTPSGETEELNIKTKGVGRADAARTKRWAPEAVPKKG